MQLIEHLDQQTRTIVETGYREALERPVTLRANTLKATVDDVCRDLNARDIVYERVPWYDDALVVRDARQRDLLGARHLPRGAYLPAKPSPSMLPPLLLEPRAGADILDMCAAPGGKTAQIAALTGIAAHLTACEMSAPRAEKLTYNLDKLGAANVNVMRTDARTSSTSSSASTRFCSTRPAPERERIEPETSAPRSV